MIVAKSAGISHSDAYCAVLQGCIYIVSGVAGYTDNLSHTFYSDKVERYDIANDTWTSVADLLVPQPSDRLIDCDDDEIDPPGTLNGVVVARGALWAVHIGSGTHDALARLDAGTGDWKRCAPLPSCIDHGQDGVFLFVAPKQPDNIFVILKRDPKGSVPASPKGPSMRVFRYDPSSDTWDTPFCDIVHTEDMPMGCWCESDIDFCMLRALE